MAEANQRGTRATVLAFEQAVHTSGAIINVDLRYLHSFLSSDKELYAGYWRQTDAQTRKSANPDLDRRRRAVDSGLFGAYAGEIRFAVLSLDGLGLSSYGLYAMRLRDFAIAERASLLEENSFSFVDRYDVLKTNRIPQGYRAIWQNRNMLAVAKLAARITTLTKSQDFGKILLSSDGKRANDDFIEVHIFGPFSNNAIESVRGPGRARSTLDRALLEEVKSLLVQKGARWEEE